MAVSVGGSVKVNASSGAGVGVYRYHGGGKPEIYENAKAFLRFTPGKLVQPEAAVAAVAVALPILIWIAAAAAVTEAAGKKQNWQQQSQQNQAEKRRIWIAV